ncbi:MAG: enoyl-CoA hydratase-related protein, partial [Hyphomonadaceae bacterium]
DLSDFAAAATGGEATAAGGFIEAIAQFPKPLIGAVPGLAVGVGATMLLHCDLVFVADDAKLTTPFVNLALVPEAASSMLLPERIGYARSFAMFTLGEHLTGSQAAELGVANASMAASEVLGVARAAAVQLTKRPLGAVMATKKLMRDSETILKQLRTEGAVFGQQLKSAEAMEAFMAFREKRAPDFSKL